MLQSCGDSAVLQFNRTKSFSGGRNSIRSQDVDKIVPASYDGSAEADSIIFSVAVRIVICKCIQYVVKGIQVRRHFLIDSLEPVGTDTHVLSIGFSGGKDRIHFSIFVDWGIS